jgi:uncharacterized oxidoreductase
MPTCSVRLDAGTLLALDGQAGFGQVIGHEAMQLGIARAQEHGSCVMALARSHHLCRIGAWAEMAAAQGLVSIHFANVISRPIVAPWGGGDARFGTNPFAVGIPVPGSEPFILDMATSVIAQGKARVAYNKGETLAPGQLLDDRGRPSHRPEVRRGRAAGRSAHIRGAQGLRPGHGVRAAGGALAGGPRHARAVAWTAAGAQRHAHDPPRSAAHRRRRRLGARAARVPRLGQGIAAAGRRRARAHRRRARARDARARLAEGIPVDDNTWKELLAAATRLGRDAALMERLAGPGG